MYKFFPDVLGLPQLKLNYVPHPEAARGGSVEACHVEKAASRKNLRTACHEIVGPALKLFSS